MISQTTEYALRAIVCLARSAPTLRWSVRELARRTSVPEGYLSKVMQQLAHAGIVGSRRGRHGGYELLRQPSELTILAVIDAVDPLPRIHHCPLGLAEHREHLCALHRRVDEQMERVQSAFATTTFADLLADPGPQWPLGEPLDPASDPLPQEV